jgi:hypothetical protein
MPSIPLYPSSPYPLVPSSPHLTISSSSQQHLSPVLTLSHPIKSKNKEFSDLAMPHATAKVNGITVAETDTYEVVDGNVYVRPGPLLLPFPSYHLVPFQFFAALPFTLLITIPSSPLHPSTSPSSAQRLPQHTALTKATPRTTPSPPTRPRSKTRHGTMPTHCPSTTRSRITLLSTKGRLKCRLRSF